MNMFINIFIKKLVNVNLWPLVMLGSLAVMRTLLAISIFKVVDLGLVA